MSTLVGIVILYAAIGSVTTATAAAVTVARSETAEIERVLADPRRLVLDLVAGVVFWLPVGVLLLWHGRRSR